MDPDSEANVNDPYQNTRGHDHSETLVQEDKVVEDGEGEEGPVGSRRRARREYALPTAKRLRGCERRDNGVIHLTPGVTWKIPPFFDDLDPDTTCPRWIMGGFNSSALSDALLKKRVSAANLDDLQLQRPHFGPDVARSGNRRQRRRRARGAGEEAGPTDSRPASEAGDRDRIRKRSAAAVLGDEVDELLGIPGVSELHRQQLLAALERGRVADAASFDAVNDLALLNDDDSEERRAEVAGAVRDCRSEREAAKAAIKQAADEAREAVLQQLREKRLETLEVQRQEQDKEREGGRSARHWVALARRDVLRGHRLSIISRRRTAVEAKRAAEACQKEVRMRAMRQARLPARVPPTRMRKLVRDMLHFWKKVDKEDSSEKRRAERIAQERRRKEEETREAQRHSQRLAFLLSQTELYSHFMASKMGMPGDAPGNELLNSHPDLGLSPQEQEAARKEAQVQAQAAINATAGRREEFDRQSAAYRRVGGAAPAQVSMEPTAEPDNSNVTQPRMFTGSLKDYQLKGLQWLVNLYEQGLNGILADEMGLGKTVQALVFLAHLAEEKNIRGPFLVVCPASTLHNWKDEICNFVPDLKLLPYWGNVAERKTLRRWLDNKKLYRHDSHFQVVLTSYQLLVSDEKHFRPVKWQYLVLDEAQALKNSSSNRWKSLLGFNCRNRLLLTGTPIQNSMAELWALLHFIMPTLFDSHAQFNEWFSKGIEGSSRGDENALSQHQLSRLHQILKPFMLRRIKQDVEVEMSKKREVVVHCQLSRRQQAMYTAIRRKICISDLLRGHDSTVSDKRMLNLMNLVIQLRKVCNHPEIFDPAQGRFVYYFKTHVGGVSTGGTEAITGVNDTNPVQLVVPKLLWREGMMCLPTPACGSANAFVSGSCWLNPKMSIFHPEHVLHSATCASWRGSIGVDACSQRDSGWGFSRLIELSPADISRVATGDVLDRWAVERLRFRAAAHHWACKAGVDWGAGCDPALEMHGTRHIQKTDADRRASPLRTLELVLRSTWSFLRRPNSNAAAMEEGPLVRSHARRIAAAVSLLRAAYCYIPAVQAPPITLACSDYGCTLQTQEARKDRWTDWLLTSVGHHPPPDAMVRSNTHLLVELSTRRGQRPMLGPIRHVVSSSAPMQAYALAAALADSGKLQAMDALLAKLKTEGHRVLIFTQMTKMLNLLEDYMNYRKYRYVRLDGSSAIEDRRDMVKDFQSNPEIFVFLLSTRAGGLGINLTAADTVIFYESDWNPTMDLQAMDRAHRLGQTKEVTVYRLVCRNTVEEKILRRAAQKNTVQQLVMTGQQQGDVFSADEVVSLLMDEDEPNAQLVQKLQEQAKRKGSRNKQNWSITAKNVRMDTEDAAIDDGLQREEDEEDINNDLSQQEVQDPTPKKTKTKRKVIIKTVSRPETVENRRGSSRRSKLA